VPTYVYREILEDGTEGGTFEIVQRMADDALTVHPKTGRPVKRVLQPPGIPFKSGGPGKKASLDDGNLARLGFTKYAKASDGQYEKVAGAGPDLIDRSAYAAPAESSSSDSGGGEIYPFA
jgi:predicted nucleic acid-binding Zn ribbon protein